LNLASRSTEGFNLADVEFVQQVAAQIALAVENALAFKEIDALKDKLAVEKLYLEEEIRTEFNFEEIIGESASLKRTLAQVELAAPAGTTHAQSAPCRFPYPPDQHGRPRRRRQFHLRQASVSAKRSPQ